MLLSIILPVYNRESTICHAIDSVLTQTSEDWELIIIDDGSTDNTVKIIENYIRNNSKIKLIINQQNLGPAGARNRGIDEAKGEYIGFIDSDDTYEPQYVEVMLGKATETEADVIWCQYYTIKKGEKRNPDLIVLPWNTHINNHEALKILFRHAPGQESLCNKIFSRQFINLLPFPRLNPIKIYGEDYEFIISTFTEISKLIIIPDILYNYTIDYGNSICDVFRVSDIKFLTDTLLRFHELNKNLNLKYKFQYNTWDYYRIVEKIYSCTKQTQIIEFKRLIDWPSVSWFINQIELSDISLTYKIMLWFLRRRMISSAYLFCRFKQQFWDKLKMG